MEIGMKYRHYSPNVPFILVIHGVSRFTTQILSYQASNPGSKIGILSAFKHVELEGCVEYYCKIKSHGSG